MAKSLKVEDWYKIMEANNGTTDSHNRKGWSVIYKYAKKQQDIS